MMIFYPPREKSTPATDMQSCAELTRQAVWIDLFEPTREEEKAVEEALGMEIPTRSEMQEIELSRRLYVERGTLFMTATILTKADTSHPESSAVTFILSPEKLITVRYTSPRAFEVFQRRRELDFQGYDTPLKAFVGLLDAVAERLADVLENTSAGLDQLSLEVFSHGSEGELPAFGVSPEKLAAPAPRVVPTGTRDFQETLRRVGRCSDLVSRTRESLVSLSRLISFFREVQKDQPAAHHAIAHLRTVTVDLASLGEYASFTAGKVAFLLDATLGLINNEQNGIIKIVSVAAVVFLPPTLVASIYGMNFQDMPELSWHYGYPMAIAMMIVSAILPYSFFKRKGWL